MELFFYCLLLGAVAGFLAGLFGIGGGLVIVPILAWLLERQGIATDLIMIMAIATSLATIIITALASVYAHQHLGTIQWQVVRHLVPGILLGAALGAIIADQLPSLVLRWVFIFYLLYTGIKMALQLKPKAKSASLSPLVLKIASLFIGLISAFLGIGGGTLIVPLLASGNVAIRNAVGTASACGLPIAVAASISYAVLGSQAGALPAWSLGYIYLPAFIGIISVSVIIAPVGARVANRLPTAKLKRYFSLMLFVAALKLML